MPTLEIDPMAVTDAALALLTDPDAERVKHSVACPGCEEPVLVGPMFADEAWIHARSCAPLRTAALRTFTSTET